MLLELSISNIVLIEKLSLSLVSGLTAMTGETGAGKSIVLDAMGLTLGSRADRALVRAGTDKAQVIASFAVDDSTEIKTWLTEQDLDLEPGEDLVLRRTLGADGKSKAWINGIPATAAQLRELGGWLVEIHGQHDGRGLMDASTHRGLLDAFAKNDKLLAQCANAFQSWQQASKDLKGLREQAAADAEEEEFLRASSQELDRLDPRIGEAEELAARRALLMQSEKLMADIDSARAALENPPEPSAQLGVVLKHLEMAQARLPGDAHDSGIGQQLAKALEAMEGALVSLEEAEGEVASLGQMLDLDPAELETAEERLFALRALARKHKCEVDDLPDKRAELARRLDAIADLDHALAQAEQREMEAKAAYDKSADALTAARTKAAKKLDAAILAELKPLHMEKARFVTEITALDDERSGPAGKDKVRFTIAANPGSPLGPLQSVASGGELSRVSLAIKAALAVGAGPALMVFDEIDQGVGGAVADAVGRRLHDLAKDGQVMVITHSPQVAARAKAQYRIEKRDQGGNTVTQVHQMNATEREEEIARMLAGAHVTDEAREAARVLLAGSEGLPL